jgi:hypothetical protein
MKSYILHKLSGVLSLLFICFITFGCTGIFSKNHGVIGKAATAEDKAKAKIEQVDNLQVTNLQLRLTEIGQLSYGTGLALHDTNLFAATQFNDRISSLAPIPSLEEKKKIEVTEKQLTNSLDISALNNIDKKINKLENDLVSLNKNHQEAVAKYVSMADKNAAKADQYSASLSQMDSWFGLGAVWYGLKKFCTTTMWILLGILILYLILRFAASTNPIASAIFGIFDQIGAAVIHLISHLCPKATTVVGLVKKVEGQVGENRVEPS